MTFKSCVQRVTKFVERWGWLHDTWHTQHKPCGAGRCYFDSAGTATKPGQKKGDDWLPSLVMFLLTHPKTKALSKVHAAWWHFFDCKVILFSYQETI